MAPAACSLSTPCGLIPRGSTSSTTSKTITAAPVATASSLGSLRRQFSRRPSPVGRRQLGCCAAEQGSGKGGAFYEPEDKNDASTWYGGTPLSAAAAPEVQMLNTEEMLTLGSSFGGEPEGVEAFEPQTAAEAIERGQVCCRRGKYLEALVLFQNALELPGNGVLQAYYKKIEPVLKSSQPLVTRQMKRELAPEEKLAIYYNIACVYSRLSEEEEDEAAQAEKLKLAFENLERAFEFGFNDTAGAESEEDFQNLRKKLPTAFQGLMAKHKKQDSPFGSFMERFNMDKYVERK